MGKKSASPKKISVDPVASTSQSAVASTTTPSPLDAPSSTSDPFPPVALSNLPALKHTCDDAVRQYFTKTTSFTPSYLHVDTRLALGWSASLIAFATAGYGYTSDFHASKSYVAFGVALYAILSSISWAYLTYIEKNQIFIAKRRSTVAGRISTETFSISSFLPPSASTASSKTSLLAPYVPFYPSPSPATLRDPASFPSYALDLTYLHVSNNGKALLSKGELKLRLRMADLFDSDGILDVVRLETHLQRGWNEVIAGGGGSKLE